MESRVQPATPASQEAQEPAEGACGLNPEERKSVIDALLQEIDKTQKWTRLVYEMQAEITRLGGDLEVMRLQRDAAAGEVVKLRSRLRLADAALQSTETTNSAEISFQLTDEEREAVQASAWEADGWLLPERAATLRGLLERTQNGEK